MRKIKGILFCLALGLLCPVAVPSTGQPAQVVQASEKNGLLKEGKNYFYYSKGKKIKNKWKKIGKYKYYFGKKGAAVKGLKTIKGKKYYFSSQCRMRTNTWYKNRYYFDSKGRAVTGIKCIEKNYVCKLYYFNGKGKINKEKQAILDAYNDNRMYQKPIDSLKEVIGEPLKVEYPPEMGCLGIGRDVILYYPDFKVLANENEGVIYFQAFER